MKIHIVNHFCAQIVCEICIDRGEGDLPGDLQGCLCESEEEFTCHGDDAIAKFIDLVLQLKLKYSKLIILAHNNSSYDGQFTRREVIKRQPI